MEWANRLAKDENVELAAVCDIWNQARAKGADRLREWTGQTPITCQTVGELVARDDIDAVVIATADFQHAHHGKLVIEAGKHAYIEKPFGCDFDQIRSARKVIEKSDRVVQIGTQRRSHGVPWAAREFVRTGGLGKVSYVEISQPLFQQRWRVPGAADALTENDTNWKEFLLYTPQTDFDARRYREFRLFWPYSTGVFCQWMSHMIDLVNLVLDEQPRSVVASGGNYVWQDGRTNPDTAQALIEYPSGCMASYHMRLGNGADSRGIRFYGTHGTLDLDAGIAYGEGGGGRVLTPDDPTKLLPIDASRRLPDRKDGGILLSAEPDGDHMADFFRAMRTGTRTKADVRAGFDHALATTMAGMSLRDGVRVVYDPSADAVSPFKSA